MGNKQCLFHQNRSSSVRWTPPAVTPRGDLQESIARYGPPVADLGLGGSSSGPGHLLPSSSGFLGFCFCCLCVYCRDIKGRKNRRRYHWEWASQVAQLVKNLPAVWETSGSIPRLGRSPGGGRDNSLSILAWRIPMDREAWQATAHEVAQSQTQLSD